MASATKGSLGRNESFNAIWRILTTVRPSLKLRETSGEICCECLNHLTIECVLPELNYANVPKKLSMLTPFDGNFRTIWIQNGIFNNTFLLSDPIHTLAQYQRTQYWIDRENIKLEFMAMEGEKVLLFAFQGGQESRRNPNSFGSWAFFFHCSAQYIFAHSIRDL